MGRYGNIDLALTACKAKYVRNIAIDSLNALCYYEL